MIWFSHNFQVALEIFRENIIQSISYVLFPDFVCNRTQKCIDTAQIY